MAPEVALIQTLVAVGGVYDIPPQLMTFEDEL